MAQSVLLAQSRSLRARRRLTALTLYLVCIAGSVMMLLPLVWLVRSSVMPLQQILAVPPQWIPDPWAWENYTRVFETLPFLRYFWNTLTVLAPVVAGTVVTATLAAYGFARLRWPGRDLVFAVLLTTLMLPYVVTLIPTFLIWSKLGLVNTYWPLILPSWSGGGIFYIFLLRQFFRTIPLELDESAIIDGANPLQVLWHVLVPLSRPVLATVAIFSGLGVWNDFLGPLIYLNDPNKFTLALGLIQLWDMYSYEWQLLMAAATLMVTPVMVLFLFAQRYFVEGITLTGLKG
jgi:multiple sugar transport system permease protein